MEKSGFRVLIKHYFLMKKTLQTKQSLDKCYEKSSPSKQMVKKWIGAFKRGRISTNDAEGSGRLKDVTTPEIIERIHGFVLDYPKVKLRELAEAASTSIGSVIIILHEDLSMRKLTAKWVPRLLTIDQKRQQFRDSESCLDLPDRNLNDFLRLLVTIDKTWIHHYTSDTKQ